MHWASLTNEKIISVLYMYLIIILFSFLFMPVLKLDVVPFLCLESKLDDSKLDENVIRGKVFLQ